MATLEQELKGLDNLELALPPRKNRWVRLWSATWPKAAAVVLALALWQIVVWSGWKPEYLLPGPRAVFEDIVDNWRLLLDAGWVTLRRGGYGFLVATVIGTALGAAVAQIRVLRLAVGSMITGLQTMPSIAWFPLAILLFPNPESAILFVVVLGASPSIANGLIAGVDQIQPVLLRAGRVMGARGINNLRYVVLPAALPSFVAGLKQGWAFAWRSLLAAELLSRAATMSLGKRLKFDMDINNSVGILATMVIILVIGIVVDSLFFGTIERKIRRRYGLVDAAAEGG